MFDGTNLTLISDEDQDKYIFGSHEKSLTYRCYIFLLSLNRHRVRGPTRLRAIKEESKVANRDWVDNQTCSLLQYINVIANLLIMRN